MGNGSAMYAAALRQELSARNQHYAATNKVASYLSYGEAPTVCYAPSDDASAHGNFICESFRAICANEPWQKRLRKAHTHRSQLPQEFRRTARELDSCNSSDALLMNVFCYPRLTGVKRVALTLSVEARSTPEFGFRARVPLLSGRLDATEVDMKLGNLLVEAKLTESDFQTAPPGLVERYRDLTDVFDVANFARIGTRYSSYQLIRNVLAAHSLRCSFCVLHDARRPDLREAWFAVMSCVRDADLRTRCKVLTWQELASVLPRKLARFLAEKYGIVAV